MRLSFLRLTQKLSPHEPAWCCRQGFSGVRLWLGLRTDIDIGDL